MLVVFKCGVAILRIRAERMIQRKSIAFFIIFKLTLKHLCKILAFNSTFRYINDNLFIDNCYFHSHFNSIYPSELEVKDTTDCETYVSYLDILIQKDVNGYLTTKLFDKRDDFNFSIVSFL